MTRPLPAALEALPEPAALFGAAGSLAFADCDAARTPIGDSIAAIGAR